MNVNEADQIVKKYAGAVGRGTKPGGIARYESWLPCSKNKIVEAYKIIVAYVIKFRTLTQEQFNQHFMILNMIDSFIPDEKARLIDKLNVEMRQYNNIKGMENKFSPLIDYMNSDTLFISNKHDEVVNFLNEIKTFDVDDDLYCQKIYTLAGLEYKPEYKSYFTKELISEESQKSDKQLFSKVFSDAIKNTIFYGIGTVIIAIIANTLHWRVVAIILAAIFGIIVLVSLVPFIIALISGLIVIPATIRAKKAGDIIAFKNQCWLWAGQAILLFENSICILLSLYLYSVLF